MDNESMRLFAIKELIVNECGAEIANKYYDNINDVLAITPYNVLILNNYDKIVSLSLRDEPFQIIEICDYNRPRLIDICVGMYCKHMCHKYNVSATSICEKMKISRNTISNYFNGKTSMPVKFLYKLSEILNVDCADFIVGGENYTIHPMIHINKIKKKYMFKS